DHGRRPRPTVSSHTTEHRTPPHRPPPTTTAPDSPGRFDGGTTPAATTVVFPPPAARHLNSGFSTMLAQKGKSARNRPRSASSGGGMSRDGRSARRAPAEDDLFPERGSSDEEPEMTAFDDEFEGAALDAG